MTAIDPNAHTVTLSDSSTLSFDALVIATGARNALDKVRGLAESAARGDAVHYYSVAGLVMHAAPWRISQQANWSFW